MMSTLIFLQCKYIEFRAVTKWYIADSAHIMIHEMQYDTYHNTLYATIKLKHEKDLKFI